MKIKSKKPKRLLIHTLMVSIVCLSPVHLYASETDEQNVSSILSRFDEISSVLHNIQVKNSIKLPPNEEKFIIGPQHVYTKAEALELRLHAYLRMLGFKAANNKMQVLVEEPSWDVLEKKINSFIDELENLSDTEKTKANTTRSDTIRLNNLEQANRRVMNVLIRLEVRLKKIGLPGFTPNIVISRAVLLLQTAERLCKKVQCTAKKSVVRPPKGKIIFPIDVLTLALEMPPLFNKITPHFPETQNLMFQNPDLEARLVTPEIVFNYTNSVLGDALFMLHKLGLNEPLTYSLENKYTPTDVYMTIKKALYVLEQVDKKLNK